jgi:3-oxoacyl-[acyl-carrier-protein] synthase-3
VKNNTNPLSSRIISTAFRVPKQVVTNDDLAAVMETSDEWIEQRSGIKQRRYVDNAEGSVGLAEPAAREAIEKAGLALTDIDLVIYASLSPDIDAPGNAPLLCDRLGLVGCAAFDIRNQCSGFLYGLSTADAYIRSGGARNVLLIGAEVHSTGLEFNTRGRGVSVLFGDGAGAVVLSGSDEPGRGLLSINLHAEGKYEDKLRVYAPSVVSKPRFAPDWKQSDAANYPEMDGKYVFKHAVTRMAESITEALADIGATPSDISMLIPHQANLRINQMVAKVLELDESSVVNNIQRYGNTTAATIPILLSETLAEGRIKEGDLVCFAAFGAGFTWGAALMRW